MHYPYPFKTLFRKNISENMDFQTKTTQTQFFLKCQPLYNYFIKRIFDFDLFQNDLRQFDSRRKQILNGKLYYLQMECNRFVDYWESKRNWDIHEQKLKMMKPVIKTIPVSSQSNDKNKSRNLGYNYRQLQIQIQNKALLAKITKNQTSSPTFRQVSNDHIFRRTNKKKYFQNYEIQVENKDLLNKLKNIKTNYDTKKFVDDYKKKQNYMNLMCKFPLRGLKPTKTFLKLEMINNKPKLGRMSANSSPEKDFHSRVQLQTNTNDIKTCQTKKYYVHQTQRKQMKRQKIKKLFPIQKINTNQMVGIVKGIQYETFLEAQIFMDEQEGQFQTIILSIEKFCQKFDGCFKSMCQGILFDEKRKQLCLL